MDLNRNQYFMIGIVLLLLGIQFRIVDTYVLNERATQFLAKKSSGAQGEAAAVSLDIMPSISSQPLRTFKPPVWIGWALMSVGSVLILQSLAMRKPG